MLPAMIDDFDTYPSPVSYPYRYPYPYPYPYP